MTSLVREALGDAAAPIRCPEPLRPVRVALGGLGRSGLAHAAVLAAIPNCELVGVADPSLRSRREASGLGFQCPSFSRLEGLLQKLKPEAVILDANHANALHDAKLALETGAAVLIDRPLVIAREEVKELVRSARDRNLPLVLSVPMAHHPVFAHVPRLLGSGVIGRPHRASGSVLASRRPPVQNRSEGQAYGALVHLAADLLFLLAWYLGQPATACATSVRQTERPEDELSAVMRLRDGVEVGLDVSWHAPGYPRQATVIEIDGANGKLLASDDALEVDLFASRGGLGHGVTRIGPERLPQMARFDHDGDGLYVRDASFLAWVTGETSPPDCGEAVLPAFALRDALYESARQQGTSLKVGD